MMDILIVVAKLDLPDWWVGAGFVRSKVWDTLHGYVTRTPIPDIDVIYFDPNDFSKEESHKETTREETRFEAFLKKERPEITWSVTNQARMHLFHKHPPYNNSVHSLSKWVETATCIGVKVTRNSEVVLAAPLGINDLVHLVVKPNINAYTGNEKFLERINKKKWIEKWPKLKIEI